MSWEDILRREEINKFRKVPSPREFLGEQEYNRITSEAEQAQVQENQEEEDRQKIPDYNIRQWTQNIQLVLNNIQQLNGKVRDSYSERDSLMGATASAYFDYVRPVVTALNQAQSAIPSSNTDESKTFIDALGEAYEAAGLLLNQVDKGRNYTPYWAGIRRYNQYAERNEATVSNIGNVIFSTIYDYLEYKYGLDTPEFKNEGQRIKVWG